MSTPSASNSPTLTNPSDGVGQRWDPFKRRSDSYSIQMDKLSEQDPSRRATRSWSIPHREPIRTLDDYQRAPHGYPRLSTFMAHEPGAAIARRFGSLNLRVLLLKQAEIVCLEHELDELEQQYSRDEHKQLHYSVREFLHAEPGSVASEIWALVQKLDVALERYNRLLLEQKALYELPEADDIDINDLNNFVHNEEMGGRWLQHPEDTVWETADVDGKGKKYRAQQRDLVRLSGSARCVDPFTKWLWGSFLQFFHSIYKRFVPGDSFDGSHRYNEALLDGSARAVSMAAASLLPTASIIALYFIQNNVWRLVFILIFSAVFTVSLSVFTAATRIEIFLASIGLASVQAVFVGNLIGGPYGTSNGKTG